MGKIIEFKKKETYPTTPSPNMEMLKITEAAEDIEDAKHDQTGVGDAFCIQCGHSWIAIAPTGTTELECPSCKTMKGLFKFQFMPKEGTLIRVCNCGNMLFYLTPEGHMCANCGIYQQYS